MRMEKKVKLEVKERRGSLDRKAYMGSLGPWVSKERKVYLELRDQE